MMHMMRGLLQAQPARHMATAACHSRPSPSASHAGGHRLLAAAAFAGVAGGFTCTELAQAKPSKKRRQQAALFVWGRNDCCTVPQSAPAEDTKGIVHAGGAKGIAAAPARVVDVPRPVPFFNDKGVKDVAFGDSHAAAVDLAGKLYVWGAAYAAEGTLTEPAARAAASEPRHVTTTAKVVQVACSAGRTFALTDRGELVAVAAAPGGGAVSAVPRPAAMARRDKFVKIACGDHHAVGLTTSGALFQLQQPPGGHAGSLGFVPVGAAAARSAASAEQVATLSTRDLRVRAKAAGASAEQLESAADQEDPKGALVAVVVELEARAGRAEPAAALVVSDMSCGARHTIFRTTDGRAFGFGANDWLQLSLGAARGVRGIDGTWPAVEEAPVQIEVGPAGASCVGLTAGGDSSMFVVEHTQGAASMRAGNNPLYQVLAVGFGSYGTLGCGKRVHAQGAPIKLSKLSDKSVWDEQLGQVQALPIEQLSLGSSHAAAAIRPTPDAVAPEIYMWGGNSLGQLGCAKTYRPDLVVPTIMPWPRYSRVFAAGGKLAAGCDDEIDWAVQTEARGRWKIVCDRDNVAFFAEPA